MTTKRRHGLLRLTVKWLVIPAGLFLLGYYVVGPRLGSTGAEMLAKLARRHAEEEAASAAKPTSAEPKYDGPPEIDVSDVPR